MFDFEFYNPVRVIFGAGKVELTGQKAAEITRTGLSDLRRRQGRVDRAKGG